MCRLAEQGSGNNVGVDLGEHVGGESDDGPAGGFHCCNCRLWAECGNVVDGDGWRAG